MRDRMRARINFMGLGAFLVATSCGGGHHGASAEEATTGTWSDLPIVGQAFRTSAAEAVGLLESDVEARDQQMESCMHEKGFVDFDQSTGPAKDVVLELMARASSESVALSRGLNVVEMIRLADERMAVSPPLDESAVATEAASGPPIDIASLEAAVQACEQSLGVSVGSVADKLEAVVSKYQSQVLSDQKIARARERWSECMKDRGYDVTSVSELRAMFSLTYEDAGARSAMDQSQREAANAKVFAEEVEAALAQVECDHEAYWPVIGHWKELEERFQDDYAFEIRALDYQFRTFLGAYLDL